MKSKPQGYYTSLSHVAWECWKHRTFADNNMIGCARCGKTSNSWFEKRILLPMIHFYRRLKANTQRKSRYDHPQH